MINKETKNASWFYFLQTASKIVRFQFKVGIILNAKENEY